MGAKLDLADKFLDEKVQSLQVFTPTPTPREFNIVRKDARNKCIRSSVRVKSLLDDCNCFKASIACKPCHALLCHAILCLQVMPGHAMPQNGPIFSNERIHVDCRAPEEKML